MIQIGIDPGLTGGIAFLRPDGARVFTIPTVPVDGEGVVTKRIYAPKLYELVLQHASGDEVRVSMEALSTGGMGRGNASTVGSQHGTHEAIRATLELAGLHVHLVGVQRWKKFYGLAGKADDKGAVRKALEIAKTFYPELLPELSLVKDHNKAEAVLIAHWAVRSVL